MIKPYEHTQIAYLILIAVLAAIVLIAVILAVAGIYWIAIAVLIILIAVVSLFSSLTVTIWEDKLEARFGPGLIRKQFKLKDIVSSLIVRNPWYYGWGIRVTPHGLLYNVFGFYAVEITLKNGSRFTIGTDVPDELKRVIDQTLADQSKA